MLDRIMQKLAGNYNQKQIQAVLPLVAQVNQWFEHYETLSDEDIKNNTQVFKDRIAAGETLDALLPEAFATVKQAAKRMCGQTFATKGDTAVWNMVHYDEQIIGGIILHKGMISEMKTGEGKTLVATLPVYLNALESKGVHVVTVNDYLASRDAEWMWHLYQWLGLTIWCVTKQTSLQKRREQYACDITYVENSELGFDYLRDNLVRVADKRNLIWRKLNYAIVDEIDSILIDEARTPLIISEAAAEATDKYVYYAQLIKSLVPCKSKKKVSKGLLHELIQEKNKDADEDTGDYYIDEKSKTAQLSSYGIAKLEKLLQVENLYRDIWYEEIHHIENSLRAHAVYQKDKDYIIKEGEILIVDEHTGRTMPGRRYSEGLHQAIEAKEQVQVQKESRTLATITYQNFFKQYQKLSGMTGTALTEGEEFAKIYELEVLEIPTHKSTIRVDKTDRVYFNQNTKWKFVTNYIKFAHDMGQPILIGTSSIYTSELVSQILTQNTITHSVLNAKYHEMEAQIVSGAGKYKNVVVATNMAWRGTDIKLEDGLNEKIATNYARWIKDKLKHNEGVSAVVYSWIEYDLTIQAIMQECELSEEDINQAVKSGVIKNWLNLRIRINTKKKQNTDAYASILITPDTNPKAETIEQDLHYGLFVLGTEKHDSRRIDNQLRWRSGRQGDPGISMFLVALDDMIMRKMGGEKIQSVAAMLLGKDEIENLELRQSQFTKSIERAQVQMESSHFSTRKHLFEYDSVINTQRERIYAKSDAILASEASVENQTAFVEETITEIKEYIADVLAKQVADAQSLWQSTHDLLQVVGKELAVGFDAKAMQTLSQKSFEELLSPLQEYVIQSLEKNMQSLDKTKVYAIFKEVYLHNLDTLWIKHIDEMQYLREKVGLMGYAQQDPLVVYKQEAYDKFQALLYAFKFDTAAAIARIDFAKIKEQENIQITASQSKSEQQYLDMLQKVAGSAEVKQMMQDIKTEQKKPKVYQDDNGVEVFEMQDGWTPAAVIDTNTKHKLRPNDKITVRYPDGSIKVDVKYKNIKEDIESGKATVI